RPRPRPPRPIVDTAALAGRPAGPARRGPRPMKASRERIFLGPNWHVDCRLVAELPEDSVVGIRFITYAVSSAIALAVVLFTGWYAYSDLRLRHPIGERTLPLEAGRWEVIEITRLQRFYEIESK